MDTHGPLQEHMKHTICTHVVAHPIANSTSAPIVARTLLIGELYVCNRLELPDSYIYPIRPI